MCSKCAGAESAPSEAGDYKLFAESIGVELAGDVIFERVRVGAAGADGSV